MKLCDLRLSPIFNAYFTSKGGKGNRIIKSVQMLWCPLFWKFIHPASMVALLLSLFLWICILLKLTWVIIVEQRFQRLLSS